MPIEYYTARFANDAQGIAEKDRYARRMAAQGWKVSSELIDQGQFNGPTACCLASVCLPMGFLAGRGPSVVTVTFVRERSLLAGEKQCHACHAVITDADVFCTACGARFLE
jgi:hypothetical protein